MNPQVDRRKVWPHTEGDRLLTPWHGPTGIARIWNVLAGTQQACGTLRPGVFAIEQVIEHVVGS